MALLLNADMEYSMLALVFTLGLFIFMLLFLEIGRRIGVRRRARDREGAATGLGPIDGAVFGLMGLLVAFTFSGAGSRFDVRRHLIVEETNAIGTAYLRLDLLRAEERLKLQESFRQYVETRLSVYRKLPDMEAAEAELTKAAKLQGEIWSQSVAACREAETPQAAMLLLPALNAMFDVTTSRTMAAQTHPPTIVFVMLFGSALVSALLAGYGMAEAKLRNWVHMLSLAALIAVAVYVILDLEFPRLGLIRVDAFDQALVDLLQSMK